MEKQRRLEDAYRFPGFEPEKSVRGLFGDPKARVLRLQRRQKKRLAESAGSGRGPSTTASSGESATSRAETPASTWRSKSAASTAGDVLP
jgi:hypothetical protein